MARQPETLDMEEYKQKHAILVNGLDEEKGNCSSSREH